MSLSVHDSRSRGRSKSPGRHDERARSRDIRAPSPAANPKKSSKKRYDDDDSESGGRSKKKSSRRHRNDDESDSDGRSKRKSFKKNYESESESESSDSGDRRRRRSTKQRYEDESEGSGSSDSLSDRHSTRRKSSKPKREDTRNRRALSPDSHSKPLVRQGEYVQSSKPQYERERREGRHASYAVPDDYVHAKPRDYTRNTSYSSTEGAGHDRPGHALPGQYKWEYDHPPDGHERDYRAPVTLDPEQTRQMSMNASVNFNASTGAGRQPYYTKQPTSPTFVQPQYGYAPTMPKPENQ